MDNKLQKPNRKTTSPKASAVTRIYIVFLVIFVAFMLMLMIFDIKLPFSKKTAAIDEPVYSHGFYFDTVISITLYPDSEDVYNEYLSDAKTTWSEYSSIALNHIDELCKHFESLFSKTIPTSDISTINTDREAYISEETADLLLKGLEYSELTDGAFDLTLGTLTAGFSIEDRTIYDEETTKQLLPCVSYKNLSIKQIDSNTTISINSHTTTSADSTTSTNSSTSTDSTRTTSTDSTAKHLAVLTNDLTLIDAGGIAKGYIADKISEYLDSMGISNYLINLGGNILASGSKDGSSPYMIGIQYPFADTGVIIASVDINDASVVTSGIYERYFESDEGILHHIFDPKTGYPVQNDLYSVTVISDSSALCDALSTALFVMGEEAGLKLVESLSGVECIYIDNQLNILLSSGLKIENSHILRTSPSI